MASRTCDHCFGAGTIASGNYEPCASCGGSGHGSYTDVPCISCSGSGRSSTPVQETCWSCNGAGNIIAPDTPAPNPPLRPAAPVVKPKPKTTKNPSASGTKKSPTQKAKNKVSEEMSGLALILALVGVVILWNDEHNFNIVQIALAGGTFFIASYIGLFVLYYAIKIAVYVIQVVFVAALVVMACNAMGFQWARDIVALFS
ncbi:hypothetical protein [Alteromonas sp. 14N.309.X.WAT.G.H12]|uniref:hypothetical protein n=1 Tax=Alteromonas sp. 14N.309.X.WAT.G.H12 TaxID=3120824 RepID=UPI002FD4926A